MCGIIGYFNADHASSLVSYGLKAMKERGKDGYGCYDGEVVWHTAKKSSSRSVLGHVLHAIVHTVKQPLVYEKAALSANCEIYNWKELKSKYKIRARNDSELLLKLLVKNGVTRTIKELRGVYAFAFWHKGKVTLARDILGVKPLWYSIENGFCFASERKALRATGITELNPRTVMTYDIRKHELRMKERKFFKQSPVVKDSRRLGWLLEDAVSIRVPERKFGVLFSGGIDSVLVAVYLRDLNLKFTCYTAATSEDSPDLVWAKKAAAALGLNLRYVIVNDVEPYLKKVVPLIEDSNVIKVGVALPLYAACELARKDGNKVIFSGSGADEVFGGYARYKMSKDVNKDCYSDVLKIYEKNTYRDDVVTMNNNLELRVPFLDTKIVDYGLRLHASEKIKNGVEKWTLRKLARELEIPEEFVMRPKKAAQYGSGFDKSIEKLAKQDGGKSKSAYLNQFYQEPNVRLGALVSSGKDGLYAAYTMMKQNYEIGCLITMESSNPDSYMFHTPNVHLARLQAEAIGVPIVVQKTAGVKEEELKDLEIALAKAKAHGVHGIVSGALYSNYQRERLEKACDRLGLKIFSPLWHIDQEQEMRSLLRSGFEIWLSSVAAEGLDESWLGRPITSADVDRLVALNNKVGLNVAGEGGEFESLVLNCPLFKKKIVVDFYKVVGSGNSAKIEITKAKLE